MTKKITSLLLIIAIIVISTSTTALALSDTTTGYTCFTRMPSNIKELDDVKITNLKLASQSSYGIVTGDIEGKPNQLVMVVFRAKTTSGTLPFKATIKLDTNGKGQLQTYFDVFQLWVSNVIGIEYTLIDMSKYGKELRIVDFGYRYQGGGIMQYIHVYPVLINTQYYKSYQIKYTTSTGKIVEKNVAGTSQATGQFNGITNFLKEDYEKLKSVEVIVNGIVVDKREIKNVYKEYANSSKEEKELVHKEFLAEIEQDSIYIKEANAIIEKLRTQKKDYKTLQEKIEFDCVNINNIISEKYTGQLPDDIKPLRDMALMMTTSVNLSQYKNSKLGFVDKLKNTVNDILSVGTNYILEGEIDVESIIIGGIGKLMENNKHVKDYCNYDSLNEQSKQQYTIIAKGLQAVTDDDINYLDLLNPHKSFDEKRDRLGKDWVKSPFKVISSMWADICPDGVTAIQKFFNNLEGF